MRASTRERCRVKYCAVTRMGYDNREKHGTHHQGYVWKPWCMACPWRAYLSSLALCTPPIDCRVIRGLFVDVNPPKTLATTIDSTCRHPFFSLAPLSFLDRLCHGN